MPVTRGSSRAAPAVAIVIATRDRVEELRACLDAVRIAVTRAGVRAEIVVVDDGSRDGTTAMIGALARRPGWRLRCLRHAVSRGPSAARNTGVRATRTPTVVFTDSDCLPSAGWLASLIAPLRRDPGVQAVEGRVIPRPAPPYDLNTQVVESRGGRWLTCNLAVRRGSFLAAGGFDERYTLPVREDTDFAFALLSAGARIAYAPRAVVVHPVRSGGRWRFLRETRTAMFEGLLFRKYPRLYLTRLKWIDGWAIPAYYLAAYAGAFWFAIGGPGVAALLTWSVGTAVIVAAWSRRRRVTPGQWPVLLAQAVVVPLVRLWWVVWGICRYAPASRRPAP